MSLLPGGGTGPSINKNPSLPTNPLTSLTHGPQIPVNATLTGVNQVTNPMLPPQGVKVAPNNPYTLPGGHLRVNQRPAAESANLTGSPLAAHANAAPKHNPAADALNRWLAGDTTYQQQLAEFNKSQNDYAGTYNTQVSQTNRDYAQTQRELNNQAQQDRMDQQNDFAGRGILHSGVYAQALGKYNRDLQTKVNNLTTGKVDKLGDLGTQRQSFLSSLRLQRNAAKQDAIRRRAQTLGI